jgi:hypothetical protein
MKKRATKIANGHTIYQIGVKYQMAIKYTITGINNF